MTYRQWLEQNPRMNFPRYIIEGFNGEDCVPRPEDTYASNSLGGIISALVRLLINRRDIKNIRIRINEAVSESQAE